MKLISESIGVVLWQDKKFEGGCSSSAQAQKLTVKNLTINEIMLLLLNADEAKGKKPKGYPGQCIKVEDVNFLGGR